MTKRIQAALSGVAQLSGRTYFFNRSSHRRYEWAGDNFDDGGSLPNFLWHLPSDFALGFDTALNGWGPFADYAYFFRQSQYIRYQWSTNRIDLGPSDIALSWGLTGEFSSDLDAAVNGIGPSEGKAFFFKGDRYARYDWATNQVEFEGPLTTWNLAHDFLSGIDSAVNGAGPFSGKLYLFKGDFYVRYDWANNAVDPGYPIAISEGWPSLEEMNDPAQRRVVLFVTIDPVDHHTGADAGPHEPNVAGLRRISAVWRPNTYIDDFWCSQIDEAILRDPHILALFLSGSFTEWVESFRQPAWSLILDTLCAQIRATSVPILAVCGSHQLTAYAFAGWEAVAHMSDASATPVSIKAESDGIFRAPNPRIGEVGIFPAITPIAARTIQDPILTGLPRTITFVEYHHDQVLPDALPPLALPLLLPEGLDGAIQGSFDLGQSIIFPDQPAADFVHRPILTPQERCRTQALRYHADPPGRVLYTTQFHPELTWNSIEAGAIKAMEDSQKFLTNFLAIADEYWSNLPT